MINSFLQKKRRAVGENSENRVKAELERRGYKFIERVHTPWRVICSKGPGRRRPVMAFPLEKVAGDFRAVGPDGVSVLVEVKSREEGNLSFSCLEPHQHEALSAHYAAGGHSIIVWVRGLEMRFFYLPLDDFGPGKSLKWSGHGKSNV